MHDIETRKKLRGLYTGGADMETAAAQCGVGLRTAYTWRTEAKAAGDDWDRLRAVYTLSNVEATAQGVLRRMMGQYDKAALDLEADPDLPAVKRAEVLATLADALAKTVAANKRLMPETSDLAAAVRALGVLTAFTVERYPQHAAALAEIIEPFGEVLEKEFK